LERIAISGVMSLEWVYFTSIRDQHEPEVRLIAESVECDVASIVTPWGIT